jgi:glucose/arabinose dehydrogenase/PKD repeat protein
MRTSMFAARLLLLAALVAGASATLPAGFTKEAKLNGDSFMKMRFINTTHMMIARRDGHFYITDTRETPMQPQVFMTITNVRIDGETGVMSFVLDPDFASNGFFYVYYSTDYLPVPKKAGMTVSRFNYFDVDPFVIEVIYWVDSDGYPGPFHYGGDILVRKNQLYVTTGDKYFPQMASDVNKLATCILRFNLDGSIPADNNTPKKDKACWAWGIRNGWRASTDEVTDRIFIGDVGGNNQPTAMEDVHIASEGGVNFGWPFCEGHCDNPNFKHTCSCALHDNAFYTYDHLDSNKPTGANAAIIGGFVYRGSQFPPEFTGNYFFGDYSCGWIKYLPMTSEGVREGDAVTFDETAISIFNFEPGADGSLWYSGNRGIFRIYYGGLGNSAPIITQSEVVYSADTATPVEARFFGSASDADGYALQYSWDFGDGIFLNSRFPTKVYAASGVYEVVLRVSDGEIMTTSVPIKVSIGVLPTVSILSPSDNTEFVAGELLTMAGLGLSQDGLPLAAPRLMWTVLMFHDDHTHPLATGTGSSFSFHAPISGHSTGGDVYFIVTLTGRGLFELERSSTIRLRPHERILTVLSIPPGQAIHIDGIPHNTPFTTDSVVGFRHTFKASEVVCNANAELVLQGWSNSMPASFLFTLPDADTTVTAVYAPNGKLCAKGDSCEL